MLKRFIFLLILLTIAFFIFRKINPTGADNLINNVRSTYDRILGRTGTVEMLTGNILTGETLTGETLTGETLTGQIGTSVTDLETGMNEQTGLFAGKTTTGNTTPCAAEGEFANEAIGLPANCCEGLQGFSTGQGMRMHVDPGQLCYDPAGGIPYCDKNGTDKEGRYSSGKLLFLDNCDTTVIPSIKTGTTKTVTPCPAMPTVNSCPTGQEKYVAYSSSSCGIYYACRTKTTIKPKTSTDVKDTQNLINSLFK